MSSVLKNILKQFSKLGLKNVGKTKLDDFAKNGENWLSGLANLAQDMQKRYGVSGFEIQGSKPHSSSKDPEDKKKVVTIGFFVEKFRFLSVHLHEDGTYKFWESRKGKSKDKDKGKGKDMDEDKKEGSSSTGESSVVSGGGGGGGGSSSSSNKGSVAKIEDSNGMPVYQHPDGEIYPVNGDQQTGGY